MDRRISRLLVLGVALLVCLTASADDGVVVKYFGSGDSSPHTCIGNEMVVVKISAPVRDGTPNAEALRASKLDKYQSDPSKFTVLEFMGAAVDDRVQNSTAYLLSDVASYEWSSDFGGYRAKLRDGRVLRMWGLFHCAPAANESDRTNTDRVLDRCVETLEAQVMCLDVASGRKVATAVYRVRRGKHIAQGNFRRIGSPANNPITNVVAVEFPDETEFRSLYAAAQRKNAAQEEVDKKVALMQERAREHNAGIFESAKREKLAQFQEFSRQYKKGDEVSCEAPLHLPSREYDPLASARSALTDDTDLACNGQSIKFGHFEHSDWVVVSISPIQDSKTQSQQIFILLRKTS